LRRLRSLNKVLKYVPLGGGLLLGLGYLARKAARTIAREWDDPMIELTRIPMMEASSVYVDWNRHKGDEPAFYIRRNENFEHYDLDSHGICYPPQGTKEVKLVVTRISGRTYEETKTL
jgi:hypothetical protein